MHREPPPMHLPWSRPFRTAADPRAEQPPTRYIDGCPVPDSHASRSVRPGSTTPTPQLSQPPSIPDRAVTVRAVTEHYRRPTEIRPSSLVADTDLGERGSSITSISTSPFSDSAATS